MMKTWIVRAILSSVLVSTSVMAGDKPDCEILHSRWDSTFHHVSLFNCQITKKTIQRLEDDFNQAADKKIKISLIKVSVDNHSASLFMKRLLQRDNIHRIEFNDTVMAPGEMEKLGGVKNLKALQFNTSGITDKTFLKISKNPSLHTLDIDEEKISVKALIHFMAKHSMKELALSNKRIKPSEMALLEKTMAPLKSLYLSYVNVKNLKFLSRLDHLNALSLNSMSISEEDAETISKLSRLESLAISSPVALTAAGTNYFRQLTTLKSLYLDGFGSDALPGDEGIEFIADLSQLEFLFIEGLGIGDEGAKTISQSLNLKQLILFYNQIGDEGAMAISHLSKLNALYLDWNRVSDNGAIAFAQHPSISVLSLTSNKIADAGGIALANNANLTWLNLSKNLLTDQTAYVFATQTTTMDFLGIGGNQLSDDAIRALLNNPNIARVGLETAYNNRTAACVLSKDLIKSPSIFNNHSSKRLHHEKMSFPDCSVFNSQQLCIHSCRSSRSPNHCIAQCRTERL